MFLPMYVPRTLLPALFIFVSQFTSHQPSYSKRFLRFLGFVGLDRVRIPLVMLQYLHGCSKNLHLSDDVIVNQLFGVVSGLGMGILTFDWNQIAFIGSPLMIPWWAEVHIMVGFVLLYWLAVPLLYYTNVRVEPWIVSSPDPLLILPFHRCGISHTSRSWETRHTTVLETRTTLPVW